MEFYNGNMTTLNTNTNHLDHFSLTHKKCDLSARTLSTEAESELRGTSLTNTLPANSQEYFSRCSESDHIATGSNSSSRLERITIVAKLSQHVGRVSGFEVIVECQKSFAQRLKSKNNQLSADELLALQQGIMDSLIVNFDGKKIALKDIDIEHYQHKGTAPLSNDLDCLEVTALKAVLGKQSDAVGGGPDQLSFSIKENERAQSGLPVVGDDSLVKPREAETEAHSAQECPKNKSAINNDKAPMEHVFLNNHTQLEATNQNSLEGLSEWGDDSSVDRLAFSNLELQERDLSVKPFNGVDQLVCNLKQDIKNSRRPALLDTLVEELSVKVERFVQDKTKKRVEERQMEVEHISDLYKKKYDKVIGLQNDDKSDNDKSDLMSSVVEHVENRVKPLIWVGAGSAYALVGAAVGALGSVTLGLALAATVIPAAWFVRKYCFETNLVQRMTSKAKNNHAEYAKKNLASGNVKKAFLPRGVRNLKAHDLKNKIGDIYDTLQVSCWNKLNNDIKISAREKPACIKNLIREVLVAQLFSQWQNPDDISDEDINDKLSCFLRGDTTRSKALLTTILSQLTKNLHERMDQVLDQLLPAIRLSYEVTPAELKRLQYLQREGNLEGDTRFIQTVTGSTQVDFKLNFGQFAKGCIHRINFEKHLKRRLWAGYLSGAFKVNEDKGEKFELYAGMCKHLHKLEVIDYGSKVPKFLRNSLLSRLFNLEKKKHGVGKLLKDHRMGPKVSAVRFPESERAALKMWAEQFWSRHQGHMYDLYKWGVENL